MIDLCRALEQRHAERVRELAEQSKTEHDQLTAQNQQLEARLANLESEEGLNKMELNRLLAENQQLQEEQQNLVSQLTVLQVERDTLRGHVQELSAIQEKVSLKLVYWDLLNLVLSFTNLKKCRKTGTSSRLWIESRDLNLKTGV